MTEKKMVEVVFFLPDVNGKPRIHTHAGVRYKDGDKARVTEGAAKKLREKKLIK